MQARGASRPPLGGFSAAEVEAHLERVLASEAFRTSQRSQDFLRFVVRRVLDGQTESIKERTIAIEVFGRPLSYDSSEDSFVRVKASEVRRRLAAYAESRAPEDRLRIELPLGGYVPQFQPVEERPAARPERPRWRRLWLAAPAAALLGAAWLLSAWINTTPMDRFWSPILEARPPLLIFIPTPVSYVITNEEFARRSPPPVWELQSGDGERRFAVRGVDKVGMGASQGAIRFAALCARTGKPYIVKVGDDFSFADLRNQPSVLFGAFSSKWTVEMNNDFRFKLVQQPGLSRIEDSRQPGRAWTPVDGEQPGKPAEDYAIAGRVFDSKSGQIVLIAAGISTFGTQAAAEFLTDENRMEELARRAPQPLDRGNFQVLLHTKVIGNTPGPPRIVETHFW